MGATNSKSKAWDPASAPDLHGKTALVTGANSGLGLETWDGRRAVSRPVVPCRTNDVALPLTP
jgi:hypothetical protein